MRNQYCIYTAIIILIVVIGIISSCNQKNNSQKPDLTSVHSSTSDNTTTKLCRSDCLFNSCQADCPDSQYASCTCSWGFASCRCSNGSITSSVSLSLSLYQQNQIVLYIKFLNKNGHNNIANSVENLKNNLIANNVVNFQNHLAEYTKLLEELSPNQQTSIIDWINTH